MTAMDDFISNLKQVDVLQDIHAGLGGGGPGRRHNLEVLNKSGIVLLVACWEAFVEDLVESGIAALLSSAKDHTIVPDDVMERIASRMQGKKAWELAGEGWRLVCQNHVKHVLAQTIRALNTPKTAQVDELFEKVLGLKGLSGHWGWKGRSAQRCQKALDDLVVLRGSIAHRVTAASTVRKYDVREARELLARLSVKCHNAVNSYIGSLVGEEPWSGWSYGDTR